MSLSATAAAVPHEPAETRKLLLLIWARNGRDLPAHRPGAGQSLSTDDAMRLVQVRDLIAGQGWFDVTQYRLNPPDGVAMHWSRLIDLPIAILIRAAELVLPTATAERLALTVWPAGLLLALLFGVVRLARELADDTAARLALIFAALMAPVLQHFRPGAIDHHNVQLVLMVWSLALADARAAHATPRSRACCARCRSPSARRWRRRSRAIAALVALRWIVRGEPSRDIDGRLRNGVRGRQRCRCSSRRCRPRVTPPRPATRCRSCRW